MRRTRMAEKGELRVWWIPQVPGTAFKVPVKDIEQAKLILNALANYDLFQLKEHIKPDYSNAGGLEVYVGEVDYETNDGWEEWQDKEGRDITETNEEEG
jgi:hypothetical protein